MLQETHYYPFGMSIGDLAVDRGVDNKIKFGSKELQDYDLNGVNLALYDFHARLKMNDIPVFTTIDPKAEKYYEWSPYTYALNNPIRYIDPDGMDPCEGRVNGAKVELSNITKNEDGSYTFTETLTVQKDKLIFKSADTENNIYKEERELTVTETTTTTTIDSS